MAKNNKQLAKTLTPEQEKELAEWQEKLKTGEAIKETKDRLLRWVEIPCDPQSRLKKIAKDIMPRVDIKDEQLNKEDAEKIGEAIIDLGFENGLSMIEGVTERYRGLMINFRRGLIKEYDCQTISEKALVDMVVSAYARVLTYSNKFLCLKDPEYLSNERSTFLSVLSKEIDRANRHFLAALETLKQFKQPEFSLNIRTKNAFIAQNQNLINNQNKSNEIIEAK